jgi:hypothetical protein
MYSISVRSPSYSNSGVYISKVRCRRRCLMPVSLLRTKHGSEKVHIAKSVRSQGQYCVPYIVLMVFFYIDCFQFFTCNYYYVPCVIVYYCTALPYMSALCLGYTLFLIGLASLYTHDMLCVQWIPLIPATIATMFMHQFFYKRGMIPYISVILGIFCSYAVPMLLPLISSYVKITLFSCCMILLMTRIIIRYYH